MKGRQIDQMVYEHMFPRPKSNDPSNFHAVLQRSLIPEVRQETHAFYGHLETQEAKYPGLDYTHPTHRMRLSRWPWHRRFFRALDSLRLTNSEIAGLTKWEGTKWAKDKFEKEQGIKIRDSASDDMPDAADIKDWYPKRKNFDSQNSEKRKLGISSEESEDEMETDSEEEYESVGLQLNERLRAQAARREAGDTSAVLDEEWEQWLKNAIETGELSTFAQQLRRGNDVSIAPLLPPNIISAARAGRWSEIPEFLHSVLRRTVDSEASRPVESYVPRQSDLRERMALDIGLTPSRLSMNLEDTPRYRVPWPRRTYSERRTYSDLRLPHGDEGTSHRAAEASGA